MKLYIQKHQINMARCRDIPRQALVKFQELMDKYVQNKKVRRCDWCLQATVYIVIRNPSDDTYAIVTQKATGLKGLPKGGVEIDLDIRALESIIGNLNVPYNIRKVYLAMTKMKCESDRFMHISNLMDKVVDINGMREMYEELGLKPDMVTNIRRGNLIQSGCNDRVIHVIHADILPDYIDVISGKNSCGEISDVEWMSRDDIIDLVMDETRKFNASLKVFLVEILRYRLKSNKRRKMNHV